MLTNTINMLQQSYVGADVFIYYVVLATSHSKFVQTTIMKGEREKRREQKKRQEMK